MNEQLLRSAITENSSKDIPITREMITEKIDAELTKFSSGTPAESYESLFENKLDVLPHIRDALYSLPIPDELNMSIFNRENILNEVFLFWIDEAVKDAAAMDKVALSYESATNWLTEVRHEYQAALLRQRLAAEHEAFIKEERQKTPDQIIEDAWKIACMDDLLMALNNEDLSPQDIDALLTIGLPLQTIYDEFLSKDNESRMYDLTDTAIEVAQARHQDILTENINLKPEDTVTRQRIEEYLKLYGGPDYSNEQGGPDHEPEQDMEMEP